MRLKRGIACLAAVAVSLSGAAGSALAATPKLSKTLIVPNRSIGALKLGQSPSAAKAAWGSGACLASGLCQFGKRPTPSSGYASYSLISASEGAPKTVASMQIEAGPFGAKKLNYNTPLARFKTSKGIGLGSSKAQLLHAYPHMTTDGGTAYVIPDTETISTIFVVTAGRVSLIIVGEHG